MELTLLKTAWMAVFLATITSMPVSRPHGADIADLVLNICLPHGTVNTVNSSSTRLSAVSPDENDSTRTSILLAASRQYMEELVHMVNSLLVKYQSWYAGMDDGLKEKLLRSVMGTINIDQTMHAELDSVHNSRIHTIAQLAIYLNFLVSLENDRDYGEANIDLQALRDTIRMAVCTFKQLVQPTVPDVQLRNFILQDCTKPALSLTGNTRASVKRSVVITAINVVSQTLASIPSA